MFEDADYDLTIDIHCTLDVFETQLEDKSLIMEKVHKDDNLRGVNDIKSCSFGI